METESGGGNDMNTADRNEFSPPLSPRPQGERRTNASKPHLRPWINLGLGLALGLALLTVLLADPVRIMLMVRTFDRGESDSNSIRAELMACGEKAIPSLIERCLSAQCLNRERLARYLAREAPEQALQALTKAAKEPPGDRVVYALEALGYFDHEEARRILEQYARSEDEILRQTALRSMAILYRPKTIDGAS